MSIYGLCMMIDIQLGFSKKKWASSHLLSYNVNKWLNLSLFESVIWQDKDTLINRGLDINYLNPFIFLDQ